MKPVSYTHLDVYKRQSQDKRMLEENDGISMFGTTAYHAVWEKVCAAVFDNKLNTTLGQLKMSCLLYTSGWITLLIK